MNRKLTNQDDELGEREECERSEERVAEILLFFKPDFNFKLILALFCKRYKKAETRKWYDCLGYFCFYIICTGAGEKLLIN